MSDHNLQSMKQLTESFVKASQEGTIGTMRLDKRREYNRHKPSEYILPKRARFKMSVSYRYGTPLYMKHEKKKGKAIYHSYDLHGEQPVVLDAKRGYVDLLTIVKENTGQIQKARIYMSTDTFPDPRDTDYHIEVWQFYRSLGVKKNQTLRFIAGANAGKLWKKYEVDMNLIEQMV